MKTCTLVKLKSGHYEVVGSSGDRAGSVDRLPGACGWRLQLRSRQAQTFLRFKDAKEEAIREAEVY